MGISSWSSLDFYVAWCLCCRQSGQTALPRPSPSLPNSSRLIFLWQEASFSRPQICFFIPLMEGRLELGSELTVSPWTTTLWLNDLVSGYDFCVGTSSSCIHGFTCRVCIHSFGLLIVVLRQGLYSIGWPSVLASWLLGLQPCTTVPGLFYFGLAKV